MIFPWIYKQGTDGLVSQWTVEVVDNKFRSHSGVVNGVITINDWTICENKNIGKSNETTASEQAKKEAEALYQKKINKGYNINILESDKKKYFEPMLAQKYEDRKNEIEFPIYSQPKLDGVRCIINKNGMWTRNGKPIVSAPHIFDEVKFLFETNPYLVLDGELYCNKFNNDFNKIISLVRKTKPTEQDFKESKIIEYWIYDLYHPDKYFGDKAWPYSTFDFSFMTRTSYLLDRVFTKIWDNESEKRGMFDGLGTKCTLVPTILLHNHDQISKQLEFYIEQGYEGQILRRGNGLYENKRSKNLLKHKNFQDDEWEILGVEEGKGVRAGTIGKMLFKTKEGKDFASNLKFDHDTLKEMWNNKNKYIGQKATIKYFNLTPDGIPRFPYVITIRNYK